MSGTTLVWLRDDLRLAANPALKAMGTAARRRARSNARWKSRWLENRSRPRLA